MKTNISRDFILEVESKYFRTNEDVGANQNALFIWNLVREQAGLPRLEMKDLPRWWISEKSYVMPPNSRLLSELNEKQK